MSKIKLISDFLLKLASVLLNQLNFLKCLQSPEVAIGKRGVVFFENTINENSHIFSMNISNDSTSFHLSQIIKNT